MRPFKRDESQRDEKRISQPTPRRGTMASFRRFPKHIPNHDDPEGGGGPSKRQRLNLSFMPRTTYDKAKDGDLQAIRTLVTTNHDVVVRLFQDSTIEVRVEIQRLVREQKLNKLAFALMNVKLTKPKRLMSTPENTCCICTDRVVNASLSCGHEFCKTCILNTAENLGTKCPVCRKEFLEVTVGTETIPVEQKTQRPDNDFMSTEAVRQQLAHQHHVAPEGIQFFTVRFTLLRVSHENLAKHFHVMPDRVIRINRDNVALLPPPTVDPTTYEQPIDLVSDDEDEPEIMEPNEVWEEARQIIESGHREEEWSLDDL